MMGNWIDTHRLGWRNCRFFQIFLSHLVSRCNGRWLICCRSKNNFDDVIWRHQNSRPTSRPYKLRTHTFFCFLRLWNSTIQTNGDLLIERAHSRVCFMIKRWFFGSDTRNFIMFRWRCFRWILCRLEMFWKIKSPAHLVLFRCYAKEKKSFNSIKCNVSY